MTTYSAGTISVSAAGTAVTGAGTAWTTAGLRAGDRLIAGSGIGLIASIEGPTSLTLRRPWAGGALSGAAYDIEYVQDNARALAALNRVSQQLGEGGLPALAPLTPRAGSLPYYTGANSADLADISDFVRGLLAMADETAMRAALGLPKSVSTTDPIEGRVALTGGYGLGAMRAPTLAGYAAAQPVRGGLYQTYQAADPAGGSFNSGLLSLAAGYDDPSDTALMLSISNTSAMDRAYIGRKLKADAAATWTRLVTLKNILGAVSQSGGAPTGAIIETGRNANGRYTRFADGTQICHFRNSTSASAPVTWNFPAAFSTVEDLVVLGTPRSEFAPTSVLSLGVEVFQSTTQVGISIVSSGGKQSLGTNLFAIGRWN